jgi:hypothetical protein
MITILVSFRNIVEEHILATWTCSKIKMVLFVNFDPVGLDCIRVPFECSRKKTDKLLLITVVVSIKEAHNKLGHFSRAAPFWQCGIVSDDNHLLGFWLRCRRYGTGSQ